MSRLMLRRIKQNLITSIDVKDQCRKNVTQRTHNDESRAQISGLGAVDRKMIR